MLGVRLHQGVQIDLYLGSLDSFVSDACVLPLNPDLSGVGSQEINALRKAESNLLDSLLTAGTGQAQIGDLVFMEPGHLPVSKVFCAITSKGPLNSDGGKDIVTATYIRCYQSAERLGLRHLSLRPLVYHGWGLSLDTAGRDALHSVRVYLDRFHSTVLKRITFVLDTMDEYEAYRKAMLSYFPEVDQE